MKSNYLLPFCAALWLLESAFISPAGAAPIAWTNTGGGVWSDAANWSSHTMPGSGDDVIITSAGTYTVTMDVSPTISSLTLGGVSGQQALTNTSQTLTLAHASVVNAHGVLGMNSGVLTGLGSLNIGGEVQWNGGSSGAGFAVTVQSSAVLNIQATTTLSGVFTNLGTVNWLGGNVNLNTNGATMTGTIWNQAGALFDIQCDQVVANNSLVGTFHNAGLVRKRITAGTTTFNALLDNSSTVQAQTGTINIATGSNLGGTFQANSGAAINFVGGTYTLSSPPDFRGPGPVQMTGGSLSLNAFTGSLTLNGILLVGQNTIAAAGTIDLNGSNLGSDATLTVLSSAVLNVQATTTLSGVFTNLGTVNWLGGNVNLNTNGATMTGTIWNQAGALFDIQCDQVVANNSLVGTFHNAGLVRKHITTGTTTFNALLDNSSTVQAQTGTINIATGSNLGGTFQANSGAAINFVGGTYTLSSPPDFRGPGPVQMTGGSLTLDTFTGSFTLNGILLVGQNTIAAAGTIDLNGSNLGSGATLTVLSSAVLNVQATTTLSGVFTNLGTVNWLGGNVNLNTNGATMTGTIWNQAGALFDIQCDQVVANNSLVGTFHNAGLVRKRITTGTTTFNALLDNSSTVQAQTGTINIATGSNLGGTFQANSGAAINFVGGTYTLSSPPDFRGPGPVQMMGGSLTLDTFTGSFTLNGILLVGQNTIAAAGTIDLNGSNLGSGATLTVLSSAVLNIQATTTLSGVFTNLGTVNWLGGNVNLNTNGPTLTGTIWNQAGALFDIQCDQVVANNSLVGTFHNAGLVRKRITAGTTTFNALLDNSSTVQAQTGTINIATGSNLGGTFQANSGAAINFVGGTYTLSSSPDFQGPGPVQMTGGSLTLDTFTGSFTLNGILLVGQNTIGAAGTIDLNGSNLGSDATLTVLSSAVLNIQATTTLSGVFTNLGTVNWLGGNVNLNTNGPTLTGTIWNQAGALFDIQCDQVVANNSLVGTFHNAGLVRKRITAGTTTFNALLDNSSTVQAQTGTINVQGPYTETPSATLAISLSALTPGSGFGKFQFSAAPTFAGKFALSALNGYRPNLGDSFVVIGYPSFAGGFTSYNGLDLGGGIQITAQLSASSLTLVAVAGVSPPNIAGITLSAANVVLSGVNGQSGKTNIILMSTNVAKPLNEWSPIATNLLVADGDFTITLTNMVNSVVPQRYLYSQVAMSRDMLAFPTPTSATRAIKSGGFRTSLTIIQS